MRVSVAVVPGLFVSVVAAGRDELVEHLGQIALESRFEFDGPQRGGAADVEYVHRAVANAGLGDDGCDLPGEVVHMAVSAAAYGDLLLVGHVNSVKKGMICDNTIYKVASRPGDRASRTWPILRMGGDRRKQADEQQ